MSQITLYKKQSRLAAILLVLIVGGLFCVGMITMPHPARAFTVTAQQEDACDSALPDYGRVSMPLADCCVRRAADNQPVVITGDVFGLPLALVARLESNNEPLLKPSPETTVDNEWPPPATAALRFVVKRE